MERTLVHGSESITARCMIASPTPDLHTEEFKWKLGLVLKYAPPRNSMIHKARQTASHSRFPAPSSPFPLSQMQFQSSTPSTNTSSTCQPIPCGRHQTASCCCSGTTPPIRSQSLWRVCGPSDEPGAECLIIRQ